MVENRFSSVDPNTAAENLQQTALNFWMMHDFYDDLTAQIHQVRRVRLPSVGLFVSPLTVSYFYGIARNGIYKSRVIDVQQNIQAVVAPSFEARFEYMSQIGIYGSYLENSVIEELFDYELGRGVSATQVLLEANAQQIPIYAITAENIDTILPLLSVSQEVKTDIINGIHAGQHAIVPQREIQHGNWQGSGYIIQDSITGAGAYLLEGGLNGGALEGLSCDASKNPMAALINMVIQVMELYFNIVAMISFGSFALAAVALVAFRVMVKTLLKAVVKKQVKKKRGKKGKKKKKRSECDCDKKKKKTRKSKTGKDECEPELKLVSVEFLNDLDIYKDQIGQAPFLITGAEWKDTDSNGKPEINERIGYVSGKTLKIKAEFAIEEKPEEIKTVTITGNARTPQGKTFIFQDKGRSLSGDSLITKAMSANGPLASKRTQFINPLTIDWTLKYKKDGIPKTKNLGSSKHTLYVTLNKPLEDFYKIYLTLLHLATSNAGASDEVEALKNTWEMFETKSITNWDSKPLYYYKRGVLGSLYCGLKENQIEFLGRFLASGEGQCNAFERLFRAILGTNGIESKTVEAYTGNEDYILVKNWQFSGKGSLTGTGDYKWRLILNYEGIVKNDSGNKDIFGTYPLKDNHAYGKLISLEGIAGQNSLPPLFAPAEKVCGVHYLVKVTDKKALNKGLKTFYYDPSYGVAYEGEKEEAERNFEKDAVAGYYKQFLNNEKKTNQKPNYFRARKKKPGEVNIHFTK
ncbi:MAG: hypothetical protein DRR16_30425 [Candidatus Parabeggiatoa sp. nov. 3]|nr:MAG: hypothetical protein DRR16_30425 [Gammaproteobacteria bacterium]